MGEGFSAYEVSESYMFFSSLSNNNEMISLKVIVMFESKHLTSIFLVRINKSIIIVFITFFTWFRPLVIIPSNSYIIRTEQ